MKSANDMGGRVRMWGAGMVSVVLVVGSMAGCTGGNPTSNTNDNAPSNDNTSQNANDAGDGNDNGADGSVDGLTADQQQAVEAATVLLNDLVQSMAGLVEVANPELFFTGDGSVSVGTCPQVTSTFNDGVRTITIDYGDGCASSGLGGVTVSGSVGVRLEADDQAQLTLAVSYDSFAVDGRSLDGTIEASIMLLDLQEARLWLDATVDVSSSAGQVVGDVIAQFEFNTGRILINDGTRLTVVDTVGAAYAVEAGGLVIDPFAHGNLIPEEGALTMDLPIGTDEQTARIVITFDEDSPRDGTVSVSIDGADPITWTLSFFDGG